MPEATRILHVANGTCTTRVIEAAGLPGTTSLWADPLYDGPVPGGISDDELLALRARHLGASAPATGIDPVNDLGAWRSAIADHHAYDELVLWFEHDLFDQLNLVQLLPSIRERLPSPATVSLVCIGSFPGRPAFKGLGELAPRELAPLFGARVRVSHATICPGDAGLGRVPGLDPTHSTPEARRHLGAALPGAGDHAIPGGISVDQRRPVAHRAALLSLAAGGPIDLASAFPRMTERRRRLHVTDLSLVEMAAALAATTPALLDYAPGNGGVPDRCAARSQSPARTRGARRTCRPRGDDRHRPLAGRRPSARTRRVALG